MERYSRRQKRTGNEDSYIYSPRRLRVPYNEDNIETASMIQPSNTSRRVLIRFPMLTLQTITDDLSSIMLHTG